jgi:hypothetical protein
MIVRIDTKNWAGNYNSWLRSFKNEKHLENYLNKVNADHSKFKIIGTEIIEQ